MARFGISHISRFSPPFHFLALVRSSMHALIRGDSLVTSSSSSSVHVVMAVVRKKGVDGWMFGGRALWMSSINGPPV